jgi:hypothetical protein
MSKQTNDFQQLIALVVGLLEDAVVIEESKEFPDPDTGVPREVDVYVLVRGKFNGEPITIAVECVDRARKMDAPWVEGIYGKHSVLQVADIVLLVSKKGFYRPAILKAKRFGYKTITPSISPMKLSRTIGLAAGFKMVTRVAMVHHGETKMNAEVPEWAAGYEWVDGEDHFYGSDGSPLVKLDDFKHRALMNDMASDTATPFLADSPPGVSMRSFNLVAPTFSGERIHARLRSPDGETTIYVPIKDMNLTASVDATNLAKMSQTELGEFDGNEFGTGTSVIDGKPARMVVTELPDGGYKAMARFQYAMKPYDTDQE